MDDPREPSVDHDAIADLVARAILALECDGQAAAEAVLDGDPEFATAARARFEALRKAGMLCDPDAAIPPRIGPYRVLERLGRGGMGEVYLAEQRDPVERRVAVKVIRRGMDTQEVLTRFAIEQQTLAMLDHSNIARMFDAGETDDGRPYLVMEYVAGMPITDYCDDRSLGTEARLRLFADTCDAVQYAHERGILHRDLKPSNVLIVDQDGRAHPKIIDLGVAKSMQHRLAVPTLHTELGRVIGTPGYMSPEQVANRVDLDTRTDVFSLGAILYELLTGRLPIDGSRLRRAGPAELERMLLEEQPPTPSTRVTTLGADGTGIAARRRTQLGALRRRLRGDLDWITLKALERDRNRRYPMAASLAQDVRRHLTHETVSAGPPSAGYRLSRFVRRHRIATAAATAVLVSLVAGLITSVAFWRDAQAAWSHEAAARSATEKALDVALRAADDLLIEVGGDRLRRFPGMREERRRLLEKGLRYCRTVLAQAPAETTGIARVGHVQTRVAWFQLELDELDDAEATLAAIAIPDGDTIDVARLRLAHANVSASLHSRRGRSAPALDARRDALVAARSIAAMQPGDQAVADEVGICLGALAQAWIDHDRTAPETAAAITAAHDATQRAVDRGDTPPARLLPLLRNWAREADWAMENGEPERATPVLAALTGQLRSLLSQAPSDPVLLEELAAVLQVKARALLVAGKNDDAERDSREAIRLWDRLGGLFPGDDSITRHRSSARMMLADNLVLGFRHRDAIELQRRAVELREQLLLRDAESVPARVQLATSLGKLVMSFFEWRRFRPDVDLDEAEAASRRAVELTAGLGDELDGDSRYRLAQVHFSHGRILHSRGDLDGALAAMQRALELTEAAAGDSPRVSRTTTLHILHRAIGSTRLETGDPVGAHASLLRAVELERLIRKQSDDHDGSNQRLGETLITLARASVASGEFERAEAEVEASLAATPDSVIGPREAAAVLVDAGTAHPDPVQRRRLLDRALATLEGARSNLVKHHGHGPAGTAGRMFRLTDHQILVEKARVQQALEDGEALDTAWHTVLESARAIRDQGDSQRAQARVREAFDALIDCAEQRGDADRVRQLMAERQAELGG